MAEMTLQDYLLDFYSEALEEDVEKHNELNPKLFDGEKLKPEVVEKINEIVELFVNELKEDNISIDIEDIILVGSNVSYNYTKDSDLDIHIIANIENLNCPDNLYPLLYSAYKSLFNKKMDIDFYGIPVEIYVECEDSTLHSNGIYSVMNNDWIKKPQAEAIPEIDMEEVEAVLAPFEDRFHKLEKNPVEQDVLGLIQDIYDERKAGLDEPAGEYSIPNLVFKEFRNRGYLDKTKDLRYQAASKELSLESFDLFESNERDRLTNSEIYAYRKLLEQTVRHQVLVFNNGHFTLNNIRENEADYLLRQLQSLDEVESVHKIASGKYDFAHQDFMRGIPSRYYTINGKIKIV